MKSFILAIGMVLTLSACGTNKMPWKKAQSQPMTVPTQVQAVAQSADDATLKLKKNKQENNIITHFDKDGNITEQAQKGGFYRKLLGRNPQGLAVVQDYYQDNQAKQTNPFAIFNDKDLTNFDSAIAQGRVIWYSPSGQITEFLDYHQGLVQRGGYYNQAGQLVLETEGDNSKDVNATVIVRGFYDNGKILFENTQGKNASESVFYYDNGQKMWHGVSSSETIHAWTKDGKPTDLSEINQDVTAAEKHANDLMKKYMSKN